MVPAREPDPVPVDNFGETAKNEVPQFFTVESGYRFYSPELGRWLSRDPIDALTIEERRQGRLGRNQQRESVINRELRNMYCLAFNNAMVRHDILGLMSVVGPCGKFSIDQVTRALEVGLAKHIGGIREPLKQAISDNWANIQFQCLGNDRQECAGLLNSEPYTRRGFSEPGILRDVEVARRIILPDGTAGFTGYQHRKIWKRRVILCHCQFTTLEKIGDDGVHEAAHAVGWGNYYDDEEDAFDNMSVPPNQHPKRWGVPGEGGI